MNNPLLLIQTTLLISALTLSSKSQSNAPSASPQTLTLQGALAFGPSPMKMHALAKISKGKGEIDASYLPGFRSCSEDQSVAIRSQAASMLGKYYIQNKETPVPEALELLEKLATDPSPDVRYNALFNGLTEVNHKSDRLVEFLIDAAAENREEGLYDKIIESLVPYKTHSAAYLNAKLSNGTSIAYYEIYKDLLKEKPVGAEQYQDMPSSQPQLYVFTTSNTDKEAAAAKLKIWISGLGINSYNVEVSGYAGQRVLLLTTYITRDNETVLEQIPSIDDEFDFMQKFWLTPKLATDIEMVRNREAK